jgi:hypothetical protein
MQQTDGPLDRGPFFFAMTNLLNVNRKRRFRGSAVVETGRGMNWQFGHAGCLAYQMLLPKKPNRGCWATNTFDGARCFFAILRFRCGFGCGFF